MGIIQSGFLKSARKSAGGINFYVSGGQTLFRNKPQVSKSYVPSSAQLLQRSVVAAIGRYLSADATNRLLISAMWGGGGKTAAMSNFSNIVRFYVRQITRDNNGVALSTSDAAVNLESFRANPQTVVAGWGLLSRSMFPSIDESVVIPAAGGSLTLSAAIIAEYRAWLAANVSREFDNAIPVQIAVQNVSGIAGSTSFATVSEVGSADLAVGQNVVALLFPRASITAPTEAVGWAGTQQFVVTGIV